MEFIWVSPNVDSFITYLCLSVSCDHIDMILVTSLPTDELAERGIQQGNKVLDKKIQDKIGDHVY